MANRPDEHLTPEERQVIADEEEAERAYQAELAAANARLQATAKRDTKVDGPKLADSKGDERPPEFNQDELSALLLADGITITHRAQAEDGGAIYVVGHGRDRWELIKKGSTVQEAYTQITGRPAAP